MFTWSADSPVRLKLETFEAETNQNRSLKLRCGEPSGETSASGPGFVSCAAHAMARCSPAPEPDAAARRPGTLLSRRGELRCLERERPAERGPRAGCAKSLTRVTSIVGRLAAALAVPTSGCFGFTHRGLPPPYKRRISRRQMEPCLKIECLH